MCDGEGWPRSHGPVHVGDVSGRMRAELGKMNGDTLAWMWDRRVGLPVPRSARGHIPSGLGEDLVAPTL